MPSRHRQMPLPVQLRDEATLDNFLPTGNDIALVSALDGQLAAGGEQSIFLHGGAGSGKSHLLQACCHRAQAKAVYLPLADLAAYSPEEVLAGVDSLALIALDDLHVIAGQEAWEFALFSLYNRARESGCRLIMAADASPRRLAIALADLRSRLGWGVVFHLAQASDEHKRAILKFRAARRGLQLPDDVATYIVNRSHRDLSQLLDLLDRLDRASLSEQRGLSIPFVKKVLEW